MAVSTLIQSPRVKMPKTQQKSTKKLLLITQELKLARVLAGNNKTSRERALKNLKKWFKHRSSTIPFTEDDLMRIWKGLFYSMWMSDKPLIQEECAENISSLIHFLPFESALLFFKCGLCTLINEWFGIDQLRLNKFLMFVRRFFRQGLVALKYVRWQNEKIEKFCEILEETILNLKINKQIGLFMHLTEIYLEEISKITEGRLPKNNLILFLMPFIRVLSKSDDLRIINHIKKFIFIDLIKQTNLGLEYQEKYEAWKNEGFPGSIDSMKKIQATDVIENNDNNDVEEIVLDPRAGRVNVNLPQLKFCSKSLAEALLNEKFLDGTNTKSRKALTGLAELFTKLANGTYPLGIKKLNIPTKSETNVRKAVNRLVKFEKKLMASENKRKRKRSKEETIPKEIIEEEEEEEKDIPKKRIKPTRIIGKEKDKVNRRIESIFRRNSGTWFVTSKEDNSRIQMTTIPEQQLFIGKTNEWDEPLKDGEYEVFVPSLKKKRKMQENEIINETIKKLRTHKRYSLDSKLFMEKNKKKVKINTKLNKSQDVSEHHAQILSSPAIPYDSNRKPTKPLLKNNVTSSPVNPFF